MCTFSINDNRGRERGNKESKSVRATEIKSAVRDGKIVLKDYINNKHLLYMTNSIHRITDT